MMVTNEILFGFEKISYAVDGHSILKDVTLSIPSGEFFGILGPSGAGKSTLLRLFNELISPTYGTIQYRGELIQDYPVTELRKQVGMVFQNPVMTGGSVRDNLLITQRWEKSTPSISEDDLIACLESVKLTDKFLEKEARSLSGGEKQRIALARVLLNKPDVLLLDEPTANLDPGLSRSILQLVSDLQFKFNLTLIIASHEHRLIKNFVNRVVFLIDGKIVEEGTADILENPATDLVKSFLLGKLK